MADEVMTVKERENARRGQIAGGVMFILLIILLLMPLFFYQNPPPGQEGIQVNLGIPDIGMGDDLTAPPAKTSQEEQPVEEEPIEEPVEEEVPTPVVENDPVPEPPQREVITTEDPNAVRLRQQQEREAAEERERQRQEAERERQRREAEAERERQRQAQEAAAQSTRDEISGLFGSGSGGGNTNKPGDGGSPDGDPDATAIGNKSFGSGQIGGGLGSRGVMSSPALVENSQKSGKVVVELCVGADGSVIPSSVKFTQRGSTTTDSQLVNAAIRNAKRWGFSRGTVDRQCGTITYNFRVQ